MKAEASPRKILRYKTAMARRALSKPARLALEAGIINPHCTVLDYGCGRGGDVNRLHANGIDVSGWDPHWRPEPGPKVADIVLCIFVINVVEIIPERAEVLTKAWELARKALVVAARVDKPDYKGEPYGDGVVTKRGTFQHFYTQESLKTYLKDVLGVEPTALGPGVFLLEKS